MLAALGYTRSRSDTSVEIHTPDQRARASVATEHLIRRPQVVTLVVTINTDNTRVAETSGPYQICSNACH